MKRRFVIYPLVFAALAVLAQSADRDDDRTLVLHTRSRAEDPEHEGRFKIIYKKVELDAGNTAVVVCDMWNEHWCKGATRRVGEMAPRMNEVIRELRRRGVLIIHAPSGTMEHYQDTPQRKLARSAPKVEPEVPLQGWCHLDPKREAPLPIDDSDGGCDCEPQCQTRKAWSRQIDALEIAEGDAITDSAEAYYLLQQRGIDNVIVMGVHTNMCVLGRPFSIRQMVNQGKNVFLMRDMTDSMYNSRKPPFVSHVRGTEMVLEHIEKYWCPTVTSSDILGDPAHRFQEDRRPHVAFIVSDDHYHADKTLPVFAQMLRDRFECYCTVLHGEGTSDIPNTDELQAADCLVLYVRRLALPKDQLDAIRDYLKAGGALVALRTASHAFDVHGNAPEGCDEWPEFDADVLGGNYHGHGPNPAGADVAISADQADHPILVGVEPTEWHSTGSLYYTSPIATDATLLMTGGLDDRTEPLTWVRTYHGGRVFYTGLGHPDDFRDSQFRQLLVNAVYWAMDRPIPEEREKQ
jgi:type 1 glutamine amidotransferase/nicotinamidase-related amidase